MIKKLIRYFIVVAVIGLLGYNSVYFKKLDAKETIADSKQTASLNPVWFAQQFWNKQFPAAIDSAIQVKVFLELIKENPEQAIEKYGHTQGIGNTVFFLISGQGLVKSIKGDEVMLEINSAPGGKKIILNTGPYFGNAIRDVTGKLSMGDFNNTMDFNSVSTELNKLVRTNVIVPFKEKVTVGKTINFVGCVEMNRQEVNTDRLSMLPVKIVYINDLIL